MEPEMHTGGKQISPKLLNRRKLLKRGLCGGIAASLSGSLWLSGCTDKTSYKDKPNVILISIDTLRWDHVGCYGYERNTTPNIDSFAKKNILFENCYIHEPNTCTSHMSMLTGVYPFTHGATTTTALDPSIKTLSELLSWEGYRTLGLVRDCGQLIPQCGFGRGFDVYRETSHNAELQNKFAVKHLESNENKKLFLFMHYYDVHADTEQLPYDSPPPYNTMFYPDYNGILKGKDFTSGNLGYINENNIENLYGETKPSLIRVRQDELKYIAALYDGGVAYADKYVGELLEMLKRFDLYDNSLIIITSDHGEAFGEHNFLVHVSPFHYEQLVRVPLIVKLPGTEGKGKVISNLVESIDFVPSILAMLKVNNPSKTQGDNFMRLIDNPGAQWKDHVYGFTSYYEKRKRPGRKSFVRNDQWKMVNWERPNENLFRLFNLSKDPLEKTDIMDDNKTVAKQLKARLQDKFTSIQKHSQGPQQEVDMSPERLEQLRSLGYML